jgi:hypothetical protein
VACFVLAALVVAIDGYFNAREGLLSRAPNFDGVGYMLYGRSAYQLALGLHLRTALVSLNNIAPGWTAALALQYFVLGAGHWQAFAARLWPVALLLALVYWIVRRRAPLWLAIAATALTTVLPIISAGVRSSSLEFFSGQANYTENWYLDDLRPDLLAIALILWSVAVLAEHNQAPGRSTYLVSAVFAAAAVLVKPSTSPLLLLAWAATLTFVWFRNRKRNGATRDALFAATLFAVLLLPWAVLGRGIANVVDYIYGTAVTYRGVYGTSDNLVERAAYFAGRLPTDLGPIEAWVVIVGALVVTVALVRRRLGPAELIYGAVALLCFLVFSVATARNAHFAMWISMALWIYAWAGAARLIAAKWQLTPLSPTLSPAGRGGLAAVAVYTLIVYGLGAFALVNWPANEHRSHAQLLSVTESVAHELSRHISSSDCFAYAPGPGWPDSIQFMLMDKIGNVPSSTPTDINPALTIDDYVGLARRCAAILAYRDDITQVAQVFYAPPPYQPYLRAVADWVHDPGSGYTLDQTFSFSNLASDVAHPLGHYPGVSLTVELYLRSAPS